MKKIFAILLATMMICSLAACGEGALTAEPTATATFTGETTPTTAPTPEADGNEEIAAKLRDCSYLNQYLITQYQGTAEITPEQIIPYLYMNVCYLEELSWGDKIAAEKLHEYARISFVMDDAMVSALKASDFYNAEDDTYTLKADEYSNSVHNTEIRAYDDLGENEYILYIKYGAWSSDPDCGGFSNFSYWKAHVKYRPDVQIGDYRLFYYSFEQIESIPDTAISTGFAYID